MSVEFHDKQGRSIGEYRHALKVIEARLTRPVASMSDPELFVEFMTIRDGLKLLIALMAKAEEVTPTK